MPATGGFAFGPYRLYSQPRRLTRNNAIVPLPAHCFELLYELVSHAGTLVTKDALSLAAWPPKTGASDNQLAKAISQLREILDPTDRHSHIKTESGEGYTFVVEKQDIDGRLTDVDLEQRLAAHRSLISGRAAIETLERPRIVEAREIFETLLPEHGDEPRVHIGLAAVYALLYEATRADDVPDIALLHLALKHSLEAVTLPPESADAWAARGFVLDRAGEPDEAVAALQLAVTLQRSNWLHWIRLAYASKGQARLDAVSGTLSQRKRCPMAHCLAATVYIERNALSEAERELDAAIAMVAALGAPERFAVVGVYWLKALICAARGDDDEAVEWCERELTLEQRGHFYTRECCANAWYLIGVIWMRRGDSDRAREGFEQATARVSRHPMARVGLALLGVQQRDARMPEAEPLSVHAAMAYAAWKVDAGDVPGAANLVAAALTTARNHRDGWLVPIEPLLQVQKSPAAWATVLAILLDRAS